MNTALILSLLGLLLPEEREFTLDFKSPTCWTLTTSTRVIESRPSTNTVAYVRKPQEWRPMPTPQWFYPLQPWTNQWQPAPMPYWHDPMPLYPFDDQWGQPWRRFPTNDVPLESTGTNTFSLIGTTNNLVLSDDITIKGIDINHDALKKAIKDALKEIEMGKPPVTADRYLFPLPGKVDTEALLNLIRRLYSGEMICVPSSE